MIRELRIFNWDCLRRPGSTTSRTCTTEWCPSIWQSTSMTTSYENASVHRDPVVRNAGIRDQTVELGVIISKAVTGDSKSEAKISLQEGFRPANEARVWGRRAESWGSRGRGSRAESCVAPLYPPPASLLQQLLVLLSRRPIPISPNPLSSTYTLQQRTIIISLQTNQLFLWKSPSLSSSVFFRSLAPVSSSVHRLGESSFSSLLGSMARRVDCRVFGSDEQRRANEVEERPSRPKHTRSKTTSRS